MGMSDPTPLGPLGTVPSDPTGASGPTGPAGAGAAGQSASAVRARSFSFAYPGGAPPQVGPTDWELPEGAFALLTGATGSGKTTLLRCLVPALAPVGEREGELRLFGRDPTDLAPGEAARLVGHVSQDPQTQVVCDTVWHELAFGLENLGVPQDQMRRRVAEVAHFFGIEPWLHRRTAGLSGGELQVLALASVLALRPRLVVLDEPTAQLDPVAERSLLHALFRANRELGVTVLVATHAPEAMVDYATVAFELAGGVVRERPLAGLAAVPLELGRPAAGHPDPPRGERPVVRLRDVWVRHARDGAWVLRGLDLEVAPGEVHALVGGNGCGKTTLLHTVAGVLRPERGRVANALARRQALLPQDPKALFAADTVADELREWQRACGYADADVADALARLGLVGREDQCPLDLSGGEQQLLALAKLSLARPGLLLLDEPTKGLDARAACAFARELGCLVGEGATVVMATHDVTFAALLADRVTMLFDGECACTEPAADFFAGNLFYRPARNAFARMWLADRDIGDSHQCPENRDKGDCHQCPEGGEGAR